MNEELYFLEAINAGEPNADLIYADWLEEQGRPEADEVRDQVIVVLREWSWNNSRSQSQFRSRPWSRSRSRFSFYPRSWSCSRSGHLSSSRSRSYSRSRSWSRFCSRSGRFA